jgi:ABC-2 type transport system permease protein
MSSGSWWAGTRLVAGRALGEGWSSKSWRIVTALMLLTGLAIVIVPRLLGDERPSYTLATEEQQAPAGLEVQLQSAAALGNFDVELITVPDAAAAESVVRDGRADAALAATGERGTLYVAADGGGTFPAIVSQVVLAARITDALRGYGLDQDQVAQIQATPPPEQVPVGRVADEGRAGVGFAVGIVLYVSLILSGTTIATAVATEKTTRISEVLLAVLRPTQLLVGTVLGVGILGLIQVAALAVPAAGGLLAGSDLDLPSSAAIDISLGFVWFLMGICLYAFVFAAMATLVQKVTEVGTAIMPVNVVLIGSYLLAVIVTVQDPNSPVSTAASLFPLSAPLVMPVRWASGLVPGWQLVLAMVLTLAAAVGLALLASRIYARGLTMTGRRVKLREAIGN